MELHQLEINTIAALDSDLVVAQEVFNEVLSRA